MTAAEEFARVRALVFEPYSMFRVAPMRGQFVNVNERGDRETGRAKAWPPPPDAIFVFGGSMAFGYGLADAETIPAQLERATGRDVYNFATPNHNAEQERIRLEQLLLDGARPSVAVFLDGFGEFIAPFYAPLMFRPFVNATRRRSRVERLLKRDAPPVLRLPDAAAVLDRYLANMKLIRGVCTPFGVQPLFVWQPVPCYRYDGPAESHGDGAPLVEIVRQGYELMHARGFDGLWLADMQAGRTESLYVDPDHYNAAFSAEIAQRIAVELR
ncbi:MAG TPA: hypothetical protein VEK11_11455 [Thermoanaerobaculia bacterium]|jgi:hypothetical protein|nr:hypothetical protein [Thermoanaerobaculia bacterium]